MKPVRASISSNFPQINTFCGRNFFLWTLPSTQCLLFTLTVLLKNRTLKEMFLILLNYTLRPCSHLVLRSVSSDPITRPCRTLWMCSRSAAKSYYQLSTMITYSPARVTMQSISRSFITVRDVTTRIRSTLQIWFGHVTSQSTCERVNNPSQWYFITAALFISKLKNTQNTSYVQDANVLPDQCSFSASSSKDHDSCIKDKYTIYLCKKKN